MAVFSIGWLSPYRAESYEDDDAATEWVRVEAADEHSRVTRVIGDAETTAWAEDWLDDARRGGETPSPYWLAVRFGSGATLRRIGEPVTLS